MTPTKGKLIALEGAGGPALKTAAKNLQACFRNRAKVSRWDASNIFFEVQHGDQDTPRPSPRTLALLYASDLAFRLRWEIKPALNKGHCVVAAPYVESAIAFGRASGLPRKWLAELFEFAPKPDLCFRAEESRTIAGGKPLDSYLEFCCAELGAASNYWRPEALRAGFLTYLAGLEKRRACKMLTDEILSHVGSNSRAR